MNTPLVRLQAVTFLGFVAGLLVCLASGYGWWAIVGGLVVGFGTALAMIVVLAIEARDRRAHRPVVREPQSHVHVEEVAA